MNEINLPRWGFHRAPTPKRPAPQLSRDPHGGLLSSFRHALSQTITFVDQLKDTFDLVAKPPAREEQDAADRKTLLKLKLRSASTLDDWRGAAIELDELEGNNVWKQEEVSAEYNHALVKFRLQQLEDARISCDAARMLFLIRTALTRHLGGMGGVDLYTHSHTGTKKLVEDYIKSALDTISSLLEITGRQRKAGLDSRYLLEQVLAARQSFGRSALLLSGGGTFGMNHIGVVKCLWDNNLLPRIVSGASAGSIVCSVLCTRTDDELPSVLEEFCYGDLGVFTDEKNPESFLAQTARFLKTGALFDISNLIRIMRNLLGDMTFQEAYNRTRRILNICISSANIFELPRLLNYVTAPNVIIWSAVAASCSVPVIFSPASLLAKDPRTGESYPWDPSPQRWIDGSVDNDLPMARLAEMFNVNHFIVSQVNPHVVPFLIREESLLEKTDRSTHSGPIPESSPNWRQSLADFAKSEVMHRMQVASEMGILPTLMTKTRSVLSQRYSGDITIFPDVSYSQFPKVLTNPTTDFMLQACLAGEKATWPRLTRIQNHCAIELALDDAVQCLRARVAFSPSQVDLRLNTFSRPLSWGGTDAHRSNSTKSRRHRKRSSTPRRSPSRSNRLAIPSPPNRDTTRSVSPELARPHAVSANPLPRIAGDNMIFGPGSDRPTSSSSYEKHADLASDADDSDESSTAAGDDQQTQFPRLALPRRKTLFPFASQPNTPFSLKPPTLTPHTPAANTSRQQQSQSRPEPPALPPQLPANLAMTPTAGPPPSIKKVSAQPPPPTPPRSRSRNSSVSERSPDAVRRPSTPGGSRRRGSTLPIVGQFLRSRRSQESAIAAPPEPAQAVVDDESGRRRVRTSASASAAPNPVEGRARPETKARGRGKGNS